MLSLSPTFRLAQRDDIEINFLPLSHVRKCPHPMTCEWTSKAQPLASQKPSHAGLRNPLREGCIAGFCKKFSLVMMSDLFGAC
jgi:hypothetical protein